MPNKITVDRNRNGELFYQYTLSSDDVRSLKGASVKLSPYEFLHIPGLGFDGFVGYSPIDMAKNAIEIAIFAEEYGSKFYANGASPRGVLEHLGILKDNVGSIDLDLTKVVLEHPCTLKDPSKVRGSWNSAFGCSAISHKIAVLEGGVKCALISISPNEAQFLETRKFQINEIARIFRVLLEHQLYLLLLVTLVTIGLVTEEQEQFKD